MVEIKGQGAISTADLIRVRPNGTDLVLDYRGDSQGYCLHFGSQAAVSRAYRKIKAALQDREEKS